jgi:hypothetical protein
MPGERIIFYSMRKLLAQDQLARGVRKNSWDSLHISLLADRVERSIDWWHALSLVKYLMCQ